MFTYNTQEKIIAEFIKNCPVEKLTHLILNTVLLPEWSTAVFFGLVIVVHESLVCPEQLNCPLFFRKILQVPQILWFCSIFVYLNDCMILRSIFSHWGQLRESYWTITESSNAHWCSRRKKHALRGGENLWNLKIRVNWTYLSFEKHVSIFCGFWRAVLN